MYTHISRLRYLMKMKSDLTIFDLPVNKVCGIWLRKCAECWLNIAFIACFIPACSIHKQDNWWPMVCIIMIIEDNRAHQRISKIAMCACADALNHHFLLFLFHFALFLICLVYLLACFLMNPVSMLFLRKRW